METILKVLREQIKEDDQMNTAGEIAGSVQETPRTRAKARGINQSPRLGAHQRRSMKQE